MIYRVLTAKPESDTPVMANVGSNARGAPPDISQMSPRERFLRLSDRVLGAAEKGDTAAVTRFAPMALAAYGMLDSVDDDARYHAALLDLKLGHAPEALALADTILAASPHHLLAYLIQIGAAEQAGNRPESERVRKNFLAAYPAEIKSGRPEYDEHRAVLQQAETSFAQDQAKRPPPP